MAAQRRQRREAGAEVVDAQADTECLQIPQQAAAVVVAVLETVLEAAQVEEHLPLDLGGRHLDQAPALRDVLVDFRLDPVDGEGHQAHVAFLDQVRVGQAVTQVALGDGNDQAQMGEEQLPGRLQVFFIVEATGRPVFLSL